MKYDNATERADIKRIDALNAIRDIKNFWRDVRRACRGTKSDHGLGRWRCLAEIRYAELAKEHDNAL